MNIRFQSKAIVAIAKASLLTILRNPTSIVLALVFPIVFIVAFGLADEENVKTKVVVYESADTSNYVFRQLSAISAIELYNENDFEDIHKSLQIGEIDGILNFVKFNDEKVVVNLETSAAKPESAASLVAILQGILDKNNLELLQSETNTPELPAQLSIDTMIGKKFAPIDFILPGQLGFAILNVGIVGTAYAFLALRRANVLKRMLVTPISASHILVGEGFGRYIFALIQATIIIGVGVAFFDYTLIHGAETFFSMLVLVSVGIISTMGLGLLIAGVIRTERTIQSLTSICILPQILLSGTFFSIEVFPQWIQSLSTFLPLTHLNNALRKVAFDGASLTDVSLEIVVLSAYGFIFYILAVRFFRWL